MKNKNVENFIQDVKKVSLTQEEKSALYARVTSYADAHPAPAKPARSPYFSHLQRTFAYSFVGVFSLLLVISGGAINHSERSLPGDVLYQLKIRVAEPLRVAFAPTPQARELVQVQNVEERLNEAEILAVQGKLEATTSSEIQKNIQNNLLAFQGKLSAQNQDDLDIKISAHSIVLKSIASKSNNDDQKSHIENIERSVHQDNGIVSARQAAPMNIFATIPVSTTTPPISTTTSITTAIARTSTMKFAATTTATTTMDLVATTTPTTTPAAIAPVIEIISSQDSERAQKIEQEVKDIDKKLESRLLRLNK